LNIVANTPVIPAQGITEAGESELEASLGYMVRPCPKTNKQTKKKIIVDVTY
jgi:hypothetical protein